jgi:hypothetical protein
VSKAKDIFGEIKGMLLSVEKPQQSDKKNNKQVIILLEWESI